MSIRNKLKRAIAAATIVSLAMWLLFAGTCGYKYFWPDVQPFVRLTSNLRMRVAQQGVWLHLTREVERSGWMNDADDRNWRIVTSIETMGAGMHTFMPVVGTTERWAVMVISIPYWLMTIVTGFLPFVWLINVARREQQRRDAAAALALMSASAPTASSDLAGDIA